MRFGGGVWYKEREREKSRRKAIERNDKLINEYNEII
jgi:hypothetical protein